MRKAGDLVMVSSREDDNEKISFLRAGTTPGAPYTPLGSIDFDFPYPFGGHRNVTLAVRDTPNQTDSVDLVFGAGSQYNDEARVLGGAGVEVVGRADMGAAEESVAERGVCGAGLPLFGDGAGASPPSPSPAEIASPTAPHIIPSQSAVMNRSARAPMSTCASGVDATVREEPSSGEGLHTR